MKQTFIESVKNGDVEEVRLALSNELLLDPRGKTFAEMLNYAKANFSNLFEENKRLVMRSCLKSNGTRISCSQ